MKINARAGSDKFTIEVHENDLVSTLKDKITKKLFRLVYSGRHLEDGKHLSDYNMKDGHYVEVLGRLLSCTDCSEHNHGNIDR
ncbi:hypothetical protein GCK72_025443 [Caenorhabditis remanei]|uniref:Ubiquitin-like domain-containing protein n=1 Tax=Caenorhabditis remanei TaxID=31234 RepID=A0A6A5G209_CAERE|nr:hypothetical protein GCK72_025443 [Caenorhabditis remanei]KAF1748976.1 hypothetical protein GCK72_025443 [Caenorhabditis remanei]